MQPPGQQQEGRRHLHSACGLLDADFRLPSLDYEDLIKASSLLCKSPAAGQRQFRRAIFTLFALNQDDQSKIWAFLQGDGGQWSLAPFYDVTFSPSPYGEHATAFAGFGKQPPHKAMERLAAQANFASWKQARAVIAEVVGAISRFAPTARELGVCPAKRRKRRSRSGLPLVVRSKSPETVIHSGCEWLALMGPAKGLGQRAIEGVNEIVDAFFEILNGGKVAAA